MDDTPMVRRASANKLHDFVKELELEDLTGAVFLEAYKNLSKEETQDSIRVNIVNTTIEMARKIKEGDPTNGKSVNMEHTVPVIQDCSADRSWRVRLTVAKNFDKILMNFGHELTVDPLIPLFHNLLRDSEQEVRKEAVKMIEPCLKITWDGNHQFDKLENGSILQDIVTKHMGSDGALLTDSAQPVRAALAQVMGPVAEKAGKDMTSRKLLPAISELMKDEFHDVRLNIVSHAGTFCDVLGVESFMHSCLHTIQTLIMDNHWRIRRSVVEQVPKLAVKFGVDMYQQKLEALFISSLRDSVFSVRKEALTQLKQIADTFGQQWTAEHLLSKIMDLYGGVQGQNPATGYASRVTTLQAMPKVWDSLRADQSASSAVISLLVKALKDSVPNVRFCACKVVIELLTDTKDKAELVKKLKPALLELGDGPSPDSDSDVQYFAQQGLKLCD
jgi:serine/threonine-protein phosphatase 2A regulatory subunit A